jgi:hypothetical protein
MKSCGRQEKYGLGCDIPKVDMNKILLTYTYTYPNI